MIAENQRDAIKEARNKYYREYRAKNREKIREINNRYWMRKASQAMEGDDNAEENTAE